ncbi:MAG: hypothetical protein M1426_02430, partial [Patescibacteria group bacterium]|nr:hypothetical protein [Patescibacteria group bacterium]
MKSVNIFFILFLFSLSGIDCGKTANQVRTPLKPLLPVEERLSPSPDGKNELYAYFMLPESTRMDTVWKYPDKFDYAFLMKALAQVRLAGGLSFIATPAQCFSGGLTDLIYEIDPNGFSVTGPQGWDPIVLPGGVMDNLWHQGRRQWIVAGLQSSAKNLLSTQRDSLAVEGSHYLHGNFSVTDKVNLSIIFDIAGFGPGSTASLPLFSSQLIRGRVFSPDTTIDIIEVISDINNLPGQVIIQEKGQANILDYRYSFTVQHNCYIRIRAKTAHGDWIYTNPIFIEPRPVTPFAIQWKVGEVDASSDEFSAIPVPVDLKLESGQSKQWRLFPKKIGKDQCPQFNIRFTVSDPGSYVLFASLNPGKLLQIPEDLSFSLNGQLKNYYLAFNSTDFPSAPKRFVLFTTTLGILSPDSSYTLSLFSDAMGDGIELDYLILIRSGFPTIGTMSAQVHTNEEGEFSFRQARSMGYNLIITAEYTSRDLRRVWMSCVDQFSDSDLLIRPGFELADKFAGRSIGALFINAGPGLFPADRYSLPEIDLTKLIVSDAPGKIIHSGGFPAFFHPHYTFAESNRKTAQDSIYPEKNAAYLWRTLPLFELWNLVTGENLDSQLFLEANKDSSVWMADQLKNLQEENFQQPGNPYWKLIERWNSALDAYVQGLRPMPLFAIGSLDAHPLGNISNTGDFNALRRATTAFLPALLYESFESSIGHGNSFVPVQQDNVLLVSIKDKNGQWYLPGNHIESEGPFEIQVIAWSPKPITELRLCSSEGIIQQITPDENFVQHTFQIKQSAERRWY